ncbi:MAG: TIGR00159 family protein [Chloroflexi bacterium]|nr:TIGR00159 family protein [Chloroflexota bacterium]
MADVLWILTQISWESIPDILLVSLIFYGLLLLMRGTPAIQLLRGIVVLGVGVALLSTLLSLTAFNWLIRTILPALLVAIPVIFQPELRRALERLGRGGAILGRRPSPEETMLKIIRSIARAIRTLSEKKQGAIIVLEGDTGLQEYVETGLRINAEVSTELLLSIFEPQGVLHDGAVVIRENQIVAANAVLPLSQSYRLERRLGLRHRAAVGITEETDALAIVVSEETGVVSLARQGRMIRHLDDDRLRKLLQLFYRPEPTKLPRFLSP